MHKLRISRLARDDLLEIQRRGVTEFGGSAARAFMLGFGAIFERLQTYPLIGSVRPEYGHAIRACLHAPYHVLYRYEADTVSILRVLHTARRALPLGDQEK